MNVTPVVALWLRQLLQCAPMNIDELLSPTPPGPDVPAGWHGYLGLSGYTRNLGAVYLCRRDDGSLGLGLRVGEAHLNFSRICHGGMLATLADMALGLNISHARGVRAAQSTVNLNLDYLSPAREGEWLEAKVQVNRQGQRLAFASSNLFVGERQVLRGSGVFALRAPKPNVPIT
jgi:uncharacterized protein (TIGR00369 family)